MSKYIRAAEAARLEALRRYEHAARSISDFQSLAGMYDKLDENRERKEHYHEILCPTHEVFRRDYTNGEVVPAPLCDPYWQELMRGNFISTIYDHGDEIWQVFGDWQIGELIKNLAIKQREALFLKAVRLCSTEQIACYTDKTDRAVRKLIAAALAQVRSRLAEVIRYQLDRPNEYSVTSAKLRFLEWFEQGIIDDSEE
jgi:hypothetical protein